MPKVSKTKKKYISYEEYQRAFFPKTKTRRVASEDPAVIGAELAKQALRKLKLAIS